MRVDPLAAMPILHCVFHYRCHRLLSSARNGPTMKRTGAGGCRCVRRVPLGRRQMPPEGSKAGLAFCPPRPVPSRSSSEQTISQFTHERKQFFELFLRGFARAPDRAFWPINFNRMDARPAAAVIRNAGIHHLRMCGTLGLRRPRPAGFCRLLPAIHCFGFLLSNIGVYLTRPVRFGLNPR